MNRANRFFLGALGLVFALGFSLLQAGSPALERGVEADVGAAVEVEMESGASECTLVAEMSQTAACSTLYCPQCGPYGGTLINQSFCVCC